jgi:hypothetical protein
MKFVNLTPHEINLNDGRKFPPSGTVARVSTSYSEFDQNGVSEVIFGVPIGLPEEEEGTLFIVSGLVASAMKGKRNDLVSPATGHPDCVRSEDKKFILSVPGFTKA